ncbi:hypothetical protein R1sor_027230 [Riccia sorocarpa]|uniref:Reverse transcriptase domain-containing protein n=1 Tax=Riccia sorocarpa TaxID=122646 RepID=A0ABD3GDL5_9MARC
MTTNGGVLWRAEESDRGRERLSDDTEDNRFTAHFIRFASACNLTIFNGTRRFPETKGFTCFTPLGSSTVDYLLGSEGAGPRVLAFTIEERMPESDHTPLMCTLGGFTGISTKKDIKRRALYLDKALKEQYERVVTTALQHVEVQTVDISNVVVRAARSVFSQRRLNEESWYDTGCRDARTRAVECAEEERRDRYREYKNLVRGKKRRFCRNQQTLLSEELIRQLQLFWTRFKRRKTVTTLPTESLREYVQELYFCPDVASMPTGEGPGCWFEEEEVERELAFLGTGKAADLHGLKAESIRWGGPLLLTVITQLLNMYCTQGLPQAWTCRRVVPIYKNGPRDCPRSYRTVMIANIFAKLIGCLLEARLDDGVKRTEHLIWERLCALHVPQDLINTIAWLYSQVRVQLNRDDDGTVSTLGVIQGCPLSPTLFGLIIDNLFCITQGDSGVLLGDSEITMLLFADDVALVANTEEQMRRRIERLDAFCNTMGMKVNMSKTKLLCIGEEGEGRS